MSEWQPIKTAPRDGTYFLAMTAPRDGGDRWEYFGNRPFAVRYISDGDWALFPGFSVGDDWLAIWQPIIAPVSS